MYQLIVFFFIVTCLTDGVYYLWLTLLLLFPQVIHLKDTEYSDDIDLHFFILIPCLNEEKVIYETVKNLLSLNMPNTMFIIINDGSNDNTLTILKGITDSRLRILNRVLPNAQNGKGAALNDGYNTVRDIIDTPRVELNNMKINDVYEDIKRIANEEGIDHSKVVLGVMDADTFVKRSLLEKVAVIMNNDPKVGMVQTRVRIGTSTRNYFLPLMQDLEFYTFINRMQNIREYTGTVAAAGNGQFNRLSAMEMLGDEPWSQCLLEDFDFSLRLLLNGWRTRLVQDENIYQQGVISYRKFIKQRSRWAQGCLQCIPYIGKILKSKYLSFPGKIEVIYFMMLPWLTLLSSAALFFSWFLILYTYLHHSSVISSMLSSYHSNELLALLIVILIIVFLPGIIFSISYWRDTKESFYRTLLTGLFIPIYNMLQIPAVLVATFRQACGKNSWIKTDHVIDSNKTVFP